MSMIFDVASLVLISFLGGLLSIASPCGGLLIPLFFAHTFKTKEKFFINTLFFFIGSFISSYLLVIGVFLIFTSIPLSNLIYKFIGLLFIILGIISLFGKSFKIPYITLNNLPKTKYVSSFVLGAFAAFSIGGCFGPVLGLIATNLVKINNSFISIFIVFLYSLGLSLPFILVSFGIENLNLIKNILVKGKIIRIKIFNFYLEIHSSNFISFLFFTLSGITLLFFNGSLTQTLNVAKIDLTFMLQYQDNLINLIY